MPAEIIVVTGVSGHAGFRVLVEALTRNYVVRAVVRRSEQGTQIKNTKSVQPYLQNLQIVVVKDLLEDGAFDGPLDGAHGIIHVASPLAITSDNYKRDVIDPAVKATVGILKSAAKVPTVKRVVVTSSIATLLSWDYIISNDLTTVFTENDTYTPPDPESRFDAPMQAYAVAKSHALAATERFVKEESPRFDVISILPSQIVGKNELNTKKEDILKSGNGLVLAPLIGVENQTPTLGVSIHVNDVARAHVDALNPSIPGNRRLLISSGGLEGTTWDNAKEVAKKLYGKQVSSGAFPLTGTTPSRPIRLDASETEKLLGWKFAPFDEQVKSVVDHYVELAGL